jgi:hypothetical protein
VETQNPSPPHYFSDLTSLTRIPTLISFQSSADSVTFGKFHKGKSQKIMTLKRMSQPLSRTTRFLITLPPYHIHQKSTRMQPERVQSLGWSNPN